MLADLRFKFVQALVAFLNRPLCVFDLESTTFRGVPTFGITEVYCLNVRVDGEIVMYESLINPENPMSEAAQRKTGISDALLKGKETWGLRFAQHFKNLAKDTWTGGFNSKTFDCPAVRDQNARYGTPINEFEYEFDVRDLHLDLSLSKTRNGTLKEVGEFYGIAPRGSLHRAAADSVLTFEILDALVEVYGVEAVAARMRPAPAGAFGKLTAKNITKFVKGKHTTTIDDIATAFAVDHKAASFEVGRALDELLIDAHIFAAPAAQHWLGEALCEVDIGVLKDGKLRPILSAVSHGKPVDLELDYIQLRVALEAMEIGWASRRAPDIS